MSLESTQISQDYLKVLNLMKSAKAFVPNKETFTDSMDEEADMYFKGGGTIWATILSNFSPNSI